MLSSQRQHTAFDRTVTRQYDGRFAVHSRELIASAALQETPQHRTSDERRVPAAAKTELQRPPSEQSGAVDAVHSSIVEDERETETATQTSADIASDNAGR